MRYHRTWFWVLVWLTGCRLPGEAALKSPLAQPIARLRCAGDPIASAFSSDGRTLACVSQLSPPSSYPRHKDRYRLTVWNVTTHRLRYHFYLSTRIQMLCFSPDGRLLAGLGDSIPESVARQPGARLYLWQSHTGRLQRMWTLGFPRAYNALAFSPNGRLLAAGDYRPAGDRYVPVVSLYNSVTGGPGRKLTGLHDGAWGGLAFSPDGTLIVAVTYGEGEGGGELGVWQAHSGRRLRWRDGIAPGRSAPLFWIDRQTLSYGCEKVDLSGSRLRPSAIVPGLEDAAAWDRWGIGLLPRGTRRVLVGVDGPGADTRGLEVWDLRRPRHPQCKERWPLAFGAWVEAYCPRTGMLAIGQPSGIALIRVLKRR